MKTTNRKVNTFLAVSQNYLSTNKAEDKLKYALTKVGEKAKLLLKSYNDALEDLKVDLASIDDKQNLLHDHNPTNGEVIGYKYTQENRKKLRKQVDNLLDTEVIIEEFIVKEEDLPKDFQEDFREFFEGFVIKSKTAE